jgi:hypothetical protein
MCSRLKLICYLQFPLTFKDTGAGFRPNILCLHNVDLRKFHQFESPDEFLSVEPLIAQKVGLTTICGLKHVIPSEKSLRQYPGSGRDDLADICTVYPRLLYVVCRHRGCGGAMFECNSPYPIYESRHKKLRARKKFQAG